MAGVGWARCYVLLHYRVACANQHEDDTFLGTTHGHAQYQVFTDSGQQEHMEPLMSEHTLLASSAASWLVQAHRHPLRVV